MTGRDSGGDIFDLAQKGTQVPGDSAEPRYIKSVPRPGEADESSDADQVGAPDLANAATNPQDIPRSTKDTAGGDVVTGVGNTLPSQVESKRLHAVPGGVTHDPAAKGSTRYTEHKVSDSDFKVGASDGPRVDKAPGDEGLTDEQAMDRVERKEL